MVNESVTGPPAGVVPIDVPVKTPAAQPLAVNASINVLFKFRLAPKAVAAICTFLILAGVVNVYHTSLVVPTAFVGLPVLVALSTV